MAQAVKSRVLVTGAVGAIGRWVCAELLTRGHEVVGLDMRDRSTLTDEVAGRQLAGVSAWHTAPLTDVAAVRRAVSGVDAIVHLAGEPHASSDFMTQIMPSNVVGVYNIFEAALASGVMRVVFTSTCQVGTKYPGPYGDKPGARPIHAEADGTRPRNLYAASKIFGEAAAEFYSRVHAMSVFSVRVGFMPRTASECEYIRDHGVSASYLSPRDAGRYFACAVEAPTPADPLERYAVMFATSRCAAPVFEIETPRRLIGYEPLDTWPSGTEVHGFVP